ncbi:BI1-like protein [Lycium barbarum]|uniref:BI1-like protein n=1 Tax=Lycium barbarum TaxID=112863 RepID=UPI00293F44F0|nr:BI1-like protein [Lycium barbarum]
MFASDGRVQGDVEEGTTPLLYPGTGNEENELLWSFLRKIYYILASQAILTTVVSAITVFCTPINNLLHGMNTFLLILLILLPLLFVLPSWIYSYCYLLCNQCYSFLRVYSAVVEAPNQLARSVKWTFETIL